MDIAKPAAPVNPSPTERKLEELPVLLLEEELRKPKPVKLFILSVREANIKDVLMSFAKESQTNIIIDPDVEGKVTIDLKDVTLSQAMEALLTPLSLEYRIEDGFIRVSKPRPITRIFHLNYVGTHRSGSRVLSTSSATSVTGGVTTGVTGVGGVTGGIGVGGVGVPGVGGVGVPGGGFIAGVNTVTGEDIQDIFEEIELALTAMGLRSVGMVEPEAIGYGYGGRGERRTGREERRATVEEMPTGARGVFSINRQSGVILVTSFPDIVAKVAELLEAVEGTVQRQVLIHAKIVEVTLRDEFRYGVNYDMLFDHWLSLGQGTTEAARIRTRPGIRKDITDVLGFFQLTVKTGDVEAILEALSLQGDVNVISSPKISALNNQTAIIKVGTQKTFFTISTTTVAGVTPVTTESVGTTTVTIGVTLDVTPQISPDGYIIMNIHPSVTDQTGVTKSREGDEAPILEIRESDTVIRVKDGETIVMGGLMQEKKDMEETRTPILGKVPGLGMLFKQSRKEKRKVDLVIFLTPTVLVGDRIEDLSTEELERLRLLQKQSKLYSK